MDAKELAKTIKYLEISTRRRVNEIFSGNYKSSFRGQGLEVSDLRKYEEGDDARHIDWITSARQGRPFVKKFQETRELTIILLVDISDSMKFTTSKKMKSQIAIETAAYIFFSAFKSNDKFGAIIFADKIYSFIPPRKGRSHLLWVLREIIQGFDSKKRKKTDLNLVLDFLNSAIKRKSVCFLLSDNLLNDDEGKQIPLKIANKKHDFIYINIFDRFEKEIKENLSYIKMLDPETGSNKLIDLSDKNIIKEYNKIRQEKEIREKEILKQNRIDYLEISTVSNIYQDLLLFFKRRTQRF